MKVLNSISACFQKQEEIVIKLKEKVDDIFKANKAERWHYYSRIKSPESYALKIETGRVNNPFAMDDFFACSIVVENIAEIKKAIVTIEKFFEIVSKKPPSELHTHKDPESFPYDDLRLYVKFKREDGLPPESLMNQFSEVIFEIQVKTFLQHAWVIATHDLVYKGDEINWAKLRVSFQIKAMLEHAEVSIQEIDSIKECSVLRKQNKETEQLNLIKDFLTSNWPQENLPKDIIRLSKNILELIKLLKIDINTVDVLLKEETKIGRGIYILNLSPYFIVLQTILSKKPEIIENFFADENNKKRIVIPPEIETGSLTLNENKIIYLPKP